MTYSALPNKNEISAMPSPTNASANAGFGKLWDMISGLVGTTGKPTEAFAAMKLLDPKAIYNLAPTFAVNANALTITLADKDGNALSADNPAHVGQRHATLWNGGFLQRKLEANVSLVISAGSTLGHVANFLLPIYLYLIDNAGVQELAASRSFMGETGIVTTTAEVGAGAADSATVMYSTTARVNVPFRLVAIAWFTQAVAGNWVNLPTETKQPPFLLELVGEGVEYRGGTVPFGYYIEDGSNVSRTGQSARLFGAVGTTWGVGDGATTFGLPDSRRRVSVGSGGTGTSILGNAVGNTGGAETHTLTASQMPASFPIGNGNPSADSGGFIDGIVSGTRQASSSQSLNVTGGGNAHSIMQSSMVVTKMIRWLGDIC